MFKGFFFAIGTIVIIALGIRFLPIDAVNWGRFSLLPAATITVTGQAQGTKANQIGTFSATVTVSDKVKETAVNSVNTKMTALLKSIKDFGIADADIKTETVSVYQMPVAVPQTQTLIYPVPPQPVGNGDWQASNSISITVRDLNKASGLSDLLNKSGATNVYGPNLTVDQSSEGDTDLLSQAVTDARKKAEAIAKSAGQSVGKMINVQESGSSYPMPLAFAKDSAGTSTPIQPGTSTLYKSVTVVFELK